MISDSVADEIQRKYAQRGLRFTDRPNGIEPIQAYGRIDGNYFYFRLRGDSASFEVGEYSKELEIEKALKDNESKEKIIRAMQSNDSIDEAQNVFDEFFNSFITLYQTGEEKDFLPMTYTHRAEINLKKLNDDTNSSPMLPLVKIMSMLIENLEVVTHEN